MGKERVEQNMTYLKDQNTSIPNNVGIIHDDLFSIFYQEPEENGCHGQIERDSFVKHK
jgi:hypothetical protein